MRRFLKLTLLAGIVTMLVSAPAYGVDQQLLNQFAGVYKDKYSSYYTVFRGDDRGGSEFSKGRLLVPRRRGKKLKGSFESPIGRMDFHQRVRDIKTRTSSAKYRGPLVLTLRKGDNPDGLAPFVGVFRLKVIRREGGEYANLTFITFQKIEDDGGNVQKLRITGGFRTTRRSLN